MTPPPSVPARAATPVRDLCEQGMHLLADGLLAQAIGAFALALEDDPDCLDAHRGLVAAYGAQGEHARAAEHACRAADLVPLDRAAQLAALRSLRGADRVNDALERLSGMPPALRDDLEVEFEHAAVLQELGRYDEAIERLEAMIRSHPDHFRALHALAGLYGECGQPERAWSLYEREASLIPDSPVAPAALLLCAQYRGHDRDALFRRHLDWGRRFASPDAEAPAFGNQPDPERPLRIGYVSADFNNSSAAFFIEPLLEHHDAQGFALTCYRTQGRHDALTARLRTRALAWRDVDRLDDAQLCARIRDDQIDVLVDLNGHTRGNRLTAFARRPAPVQVTYLGYGATTGVRAIDYRITDRRVDPPGETERYYVERLMRLPDSMWCFAPPASAPAIGPLPAAANGFITFGSMNNFSKVSAQVLDLWGEILGAVPRSRLVLLAMPSPATQQRVARAFAARGVDPARLVFFGRVPLEVYFTLHQGIDIALDPFPYTGGATTCNALWMGVPTLTLAGDGALARSGLSILASVGLDEWVASTPAEYRDKACALAADPAALGALRANLRDRVAHSPLCRGREFIASLEAAYRDMWRAWCARGE